MSQPREACTETRAKLDRALAWMANHDDSGLDKYIEQMFDNQLHNIKDTFDTRPDGCEMEMSGDYDEFRCAACGLWLQLIIG